MNPLFVDEPQEDAKDDGFLISRGNERRIEPPKHDGPANPAADLIRQKINAIYAQGPTAREELSEVKVAQKPYSKHQEYMKHLSTSGKSLAEIQTAWHQYYANLPDNEKHQVWQDFYTANSTKQITDPATAQQQPTTPAAHITQAQPKIIVSEHMAVSAAKPPQSRSVATIRRRITATVKQRSRAKQKARQHLQSLAVGLGLGALVLLIFLFSFFNEFVIAPFIQPGQHAAATPIILSQDGIAPTANPEVIVPKINAELPVIYGGSANENDIENSLEDGVVHYPTTSVPGQQGNAAFFGHSSNNIFNKGKYKFAFVLLHELVPGDIFYLTHEGKVYTYRVYQKQVVEPTDTWVLNPVQGKTATATLITCDPPGTSLHRLVVWGEQISPDPNGNSAPDPTTQTASSTATQIPDNGPTLWNRFWHWATPF